MIDPRVSTVVMRGPPTAHPLVDEIVEDDGARYRVRWFDPPFAPPLDETRQALGICFTAERQIVLVTRDEVLWTLPGGTVEAGETLAMTLAREAREEACARVLASRYIGCQWVDQLDGDGASYYETRFWARVEVDPFRPEYEMTARRLVAPEEFRAALFWGAAPTAGLILERGLASEEAAEATAATKEDLAR